MFHSLLNKLLLACSLAVVLTTAANSQNSTEADLPLNGVIAADGQSVTLDWALAENPLQHQVRIYRRPYGQSGGETWKAIGPVISAQNRFVDTDISPGRAYEYQVQRFGNDDIVDVGYWVTGVDLPEVSGSGTIYLVVDETLAEPLAPHITRYERDLLVEGWRTTKLFVPRNKPEDAVANLNNIAKLRGFLQGQYNADPMGRHVVVLLGHVPIPQSGHAAPDGHDRTPHATDLFYADTDGGWSLNRETMTIANNRLPSDAIEMQIGRIDFASIGDRQTEIAHLQSYLNKAHHWRQGLIGDLRDGYAQSPILKVEESGLRNIVGPDAMQAGGHHDLGEEQSWLWGVDFGDFDGRNYLTTYSNKAVFTINFGSGKQKFDSFKNPMRTLLAQPFYTLAVGWGGRPSWRLHHMALGGSIGDVHQRTVNNGIASEPYRDSMDYWPTGQYLWRNPIWVNLLGDPTLRGFILSPPQHLKVDETEKGYRLNWEPSTDPDVTGYRVFEFEEGGQLTKVGEDLPATQLEYLHERDPSVGATIYMVRALGKKTVYAGSFFTASQGVFGRPNATDLIAPDVTIETLAGQAIELPEAFQGPVDGVISSVIAAPELGDLRLVDGVWLYTPNEDARGTDVVPYSYSGPFRTVVGELTIAIE